jgi:WD40 repeat protein
MFRTERVGQVALSPDGALAATIATPKGLYVEPSKGNSVLLWDTASGREVRRFNVSPHRGDVQIQFSRDGGRLLLVDRLTIHIWDVATGVELFVLASDPNQSGHHTASFSPDLRAIMVNEGLASAIRLRRRASL